MPARLPSGVTPACPPGPGALPRARKHLERGRQRADEQTTRFVFPKRPGRSPGRVFPAEGPVALAPAEAGHPVHRAHPRRLVDEDGGRTRRHGGRDAPVRAPPWPRHAGAQEAGHLERAHAPGGRRLHVHHEPEAALPRSSWPTRPFRPRCSRRSGARAAACRWSSTHAPPAFATRRGTVRASTDGGTSSPASHATRRAIATSSTKAPCLRFPPATRLPTWVDRFAAGSPGAAGVNRGA